MNINLNPLFDFFVDFTLNVSRLFNWLFFESFSFTINEQTYQVFPIGLLIGSLALSLGIIRRIL